MANQNYHPGNVTITECSLHSMDGSRQYNLLAQMMTADIYESLFQAFIYGEITIKDSVGLLEGFPIIGEEYIQLSWLTPTRNEVKFKLNIVKVGDVAYADNNRVKYYRIYVVSPEVMTNASVSINKKFNQQISASIKTLVSESLQSSKTLTVEDTRGIDQLLITNRTPMQTIDQLRRRALSLQYASSSYVFFETSGGYQFVTLEKLIKDGRSSIGDRIFQYNDTFPQSATESQFRQIIAADPVQSSDTLSKLARGAVSNNVRKFDMVTGDVTTINYQTSDFDNSYTKTGTIADTNTTKFNQQYQANTSNQLFHIWGSDKDDLVAEKKGVVRGFINDLLQNVRHISIYGDSSLTAGHVINCTFASVDGLTKRKMTTNNYLVGKVRHIIMNSSLPVYTQSLQLLTNTVDV